MISVSLDILERLFSLRWLTGPIFDKELRVSSRRARNYILRFAYLVFLTTFLVLVWLMAVDYGEPAIYRISRMAKAGKAIVLNTVWFQFCVTQVVAVIMLSTSVGEEIYNRTLGLLMTTPINSFQIVMGKLFSKLLQLLLLMAISLPVLAIVRVFGGVPWGYVVSSLCITFTSTVFVGSLSLFLSIFTRRAYVSIILTCLTLGTLFLGIPYLLAIVYHASTDNWPGPALTTAIFYDNPFMVLLSNTRGMMSPGFAGGMPVFYWPLHCGIMLAASALVLSASVIMVRKVALRQAAGEQGFSFRRRRSAKVVASVKSGRTRRPSGIVRVVGRPVIWKELRSPLLGRRRTLTLAAALVGLIGLLISYLALGVDRALDDQDVHMVYALIFLSVGLLFSIVLPATSITSEKEARSWPLLLATTLNENEILFGKFVGTVRHCLPSWCLLLGHVGLFGLTTLIHPIAIFQIGILVVWVVTFLSGTGLYFSSMCKHTTMAVMMNFALAAFIWAILPLFMFIFLNAVNASEELGEAYMDTNPFIHALVIMDATAGERGELDYDWPGVGDMECAESTVWMLICMGVYGLLGFLFAWRAKHRLRRNIF